MLTGCRLGGAPADTCQAKQPLQPPHPSPLTEPRPTWAMYTIHSGYSMSCTTCGVGRGARGTGRCQGHARKPGGSTRAPQVAKLGGVLSLNLSNVRVCGT